MPESTGQKLRFDGTVIAVVVFVLWFTVSVSDNGDVSDLDDLP